MFSNNLTREISLKVGPVILEVLVKHYFDRLKGDAEKDGVEANLKEDDVLFHEAFAIVKAFLNASTTHTIEELQAFSNTRTPSPPWTHVVRVLVPMSCCEEAAPILIKALGGEEAARRLVGGIKWWQVRGLKGVDSQWLTSKKDWKEAKRRYKKQQQQNNADAPNPVSDGLPSATSGDGDFSADPSADAGEHEGSEGEYEKNMDAMRCILYLHGGGYYFGSVDQERYSIQRFARKINGRVFAINYRLAPQYPFPCALHDALAAYLYLIRPPPGSPHQAVNPAHIIISGDSAGGGLSLALLQVIRDTNLPAPAGGVLISPWCDLTHSFPSIHINTDTDIIPESGLSFHKPSLLWPPPSEEISSRVHASLRFRIRQAFKFDDPQRPNQESTFSEAQGDGPTAPSQPIPTTVPVDPEKVVFQTKSGETIEMNQQLQFYARNSMLLHPLISPVTAYLGGLPPLLFIAGDKEVLRDEIIYTAHRAAYPEKHPISDQARKLYPPLKGIEERYKPTSVHLQVYDDAPHILPILFMFTNPAKFCFRAIASFSKLVTGLTPIPGLESNTSNATNSPRPSPITRSQTLFASFKSYSTTKRRPSMLLQGSTLTDDPQEMGSSERSEDASPTNGLEDGSANVQTIKRSFSAQMTRAGTFSRGFLRRAPSTSSGAVAETPDSPASPSESAPNGRNVSTVTQKSDSGSSSDVGGPRFQTAPEPPVVSERSAGEISVYRDIKDICSWDCRMIRERVSTAGVTRPLEPESELDAFQMPSECVATLRDNTVDRFLKVNSFYEKKFARTYKSVEKRRRHTLERAKVDSIKKMGALRQSLHRVRAKRAEADGLANGNDTMKENDDMASPGWGWAWALDEGEDPPPSSIVSRRDTQEARKLAEIADQAVLSADQTFSGNNLWAVVINFLTATPGKQTHTLHKKHEASHSHENVDEVKHSPKRRHRRFSKIWKRHGSNKTHQEAPVPST